MKMSKDIKLTSEKEQILHKQFLNRFKGKINIINKLGNTINLFSKELSAHKSTNLPSITIKRQSLSPLKSRSIHTTRSLCKIGNYEIPIYLNVPKKSQRESDEYNVKLHFRDDRNKYIFSRNLEYNNELCYPRKGTTLIEPLVKLPKRYNIKELEKSKQFSNIMKLLDNSTIKEITSTRRIKKIDIPINCTKERPYKFKSCIRRNKLRLDYN